MTTCNDIDLSSCEEENQGDWAVGDWEPDLKKFVARRQCIAYNKYVKPWRTKKQLNYCELNLDDARTYLDGTLTKNATFNARPTTCQFNHWYCAGEKSFCANATRISGNITAVRADKHYKQILQQPRFVCPVYLRKELLTAGDPDIAGPGVRPISIGFFFTSVMISYSIEATLVLIYLLAHYLPETTRSSSPGLLRRANDRLLSRFHTAATCSIHSVYATATILSYAMVTATILIFTKHHLKRSLVDIYMNELLILAPTFSIFPVLALHTLLSDWKSKGMASEPIKTGWEGRYGFRRFLGVVLYLFCLVTVWVVFVRGIRTTDPDFEFGGANDVRLSHDVYLIAPRYVKALVLLMLVVPLGGVGVLGGIRWVKWRASKPRANTSSNRRQRASRASAAFRKIASGASSVVQKIASIPTRGCIIFIVRGLCIGMMLIQLAWLWYLRTEAMHDAGGIDRDTEWNFGQILAVTTWLPVLMEFLYCFFFSNHLSNSGVGSSVQLGPTTPAQGATV